MKLAIKCPECNEVGYCYFLYIWIGFVIIHLVHSLIYFDIWRILLTLVFVLMSVPLTLIVIELNDRYKSRSSIK